METSMPKLITQEQRALLLANGAEFDRNEDFDPPPVVKLFMPDGGATWLLASLDPECPDIAFGLCDLGFGFPEMGSVRLSEIEGARGALGLRVERDLHFTADRRLTAYALDASRAGRIVTGRNPAAADGNDAPVRTP
jgi:hypothetical protein